MLFFIAVPDFGNGDFFQNPGCDGCARVNHDDSRVMTGSIRTRPNRQRDMLLKPSNTESRLPTTRDRTSSTSHLAAQLSEGIDAGELFVVYQSIVRNVAGETHGAEALLRWQHPQDGLLLPSSFFNALHEPTVAEKVWHFVLDRVCRDLGRLPPEQCAGLYVTINTPPRLLFSTALPGLIEQLCRRHDISPSLLMLEILESEVPDASSSLNDFTAPIRALGVRLALDDFGTGFSSLARLSDLHIDAVKLAGEMIRDIPVSLRACTVVAGVIAMLRDLRVEIIVEGVESSYQAIWLHKHPDVRMQGFYFRRPTASLELALKNVSELSR